MTRYKYYGSCSILATPDKRRQFLVISGVILLVVVLPLVTMAATGWFNDESSSQPSNVNEGNASTGNANGEDGVGGVFSMGDNSTGIRTTANPTTYPTTAPTTSPTTSPTDGPPEVTYVPGLLTVVENGLLLSQGLTSRMLARSGEFVTYSNGVNSTIPFHFRPDFGATFAVPDNATENVGGWVYLSNSEMPEEGQGGVGALHFDKDGNVVKYEMALTGSTMNCAGGRTPWETFVSCEEVAYIGQAYQVDPFGRRPPAILSLTTMQAGRYEAFAYDDRDPTTPRFFMTEDQANGPTRRYTPDPESIDWDNNPWDMLHGNGTLEYLVLTPDGTNPDIGIYEWVSNVHQARENAIITYPSTEGIDRKDNLLYIVTKNIKMLYILNLDSNTYIRISTASGLFDGHPDQVMHIVNDTGAIVYFNEDGRQDSGSAAGIHGRNAAGQYFTILEGPDWSLETTGIALSPSGHHLYVAFQEAGVFFDITRTDGYPFQGQTLDVRYHSITTDPALTL